MHPNASSSVRRDYIFKNAALSGNARAVFGNVYTSCIDLTAHFTLEEELRCEFEREI